MSHSDPAIEAARTKVEEAIRDYEAAMVAAGEFQPRSDNEMVTHWVLVYSHTQFGDDGEDSSQVSSMRSGPMDYWMVAGLLQAHAYGNLSSPWREGA